MGDSPLAVLDLSPAARAAIDGTVVEIMSASKPASPDEWVTAIGMARPGLPAELTKAIERLKAGAQEPALLVRGVRVDDRSIGKTPPHWNTRHPLTRSSCTLRYELALVLLAQSLGEIFGYASLQGGRLLHSILPIAGAELDQSGHGSTATLAWHTEDAFTPHRAEYLVLMCLRNRDCVPTTIAGIDAVMSLDGPDRALLAQARYSVRPDDEHRRQEPRPTHASVLDAEAWSSVIPVLYDGSKGSRIVIDSIYMDGIDEPARATYARANRTIGANLHAIPLMPGDILMLDNYRTVHGRASFRARFDGTDRWLLKASVIGDLAPSETHRGQVRARTLS